MSLSYAEAMAAFDFDSVMGSLSGSVAGGLNACVECCDRHAGTGKPALYWESADGRAEVYSFDRLMELSAQFAGVITARGVGPGDIVAGLLPRVPELLVTILGTWRAGAVFQPLFTAFGPKAIEHRIATSGARLVVTDARNRAKLDEVPQAPPVLFVARAGEAVPEGDTDLLAALAEQPANFAPVPRGADDPFLIMFTSGTTGPSKALHVPLRAIPAFVGYMRDAVDLRPEDSFWNIADPGWAYGLYYAVTGPLAMGHATLFYDGPFSVESLISTVQKYRITNLAGSPTAFRAIKAAGAEAVAPIKGQLRVVSSAGEPLNPEVIRWFADALGAVIHDHYGQTELGMVLCNHHALAHAVRPGAAGYSSPGHRVAVVDDELRELPPGTPGNLAVDRSASPLLWFSGYSNTATPALGERWYLTGDAAELNEDGSISFVGRSDDVITSSGYRIGPFDVESALIEHAAVTEAAVIGKPDPERTEIVKAFVVLQPGFSGTEDMAEELKQHVRRRLSAHAYPREIAFVDALPKTPSGKIQRFLLRNEEKAKLEADAAGRVPA